MAESRTDSNLVQPVSRAVRITHVVFDLDGGGFESLIAALARRFAGSSITMSAVSLSGRVGRVGAAISPLLDQYCVLRQIPMISMLVPIALTQAIRATRPDVVHLHNGSWYKGARAARRARTAGIVYTEHGREHHDPPFSRWIDRRAAGLTDAVVTVSDRLAQYMKRVVGVPAERVVTIQNGVDTSIFAPATPGTLAPRYRVQLGIPDDAVVVGSIGRLEPVKAYARLVEAVATLRACGNLGRPVVGVIWGEGTERAMLETLIAARGLQGVFHLPGWTDDAPAAHRTLDVFVLTSISEGASVSLMESLATGVTPVVTDVGANAEVVGPALQSQVVQKGDAAALVAVLRATLGDASLRTRAGIDGRNHVLRHYSLEAMAGAYEQLYRRIASP